MITTIFETIMGAAEGLVETIGSVLNAVVSWFWDGTLNDGEGGLTFIGTLSVIALVATIVYFGIRFVRGLISMKRAM